MWVRYYQNKAPRASQKRYCKCFPFHVDSCRHRYQESPVKVQIGYTSTDYILELTPESGGEKNLLIDMAKKLKNTFGATHGITFQGFEYESPTVKFRVAPL